MAGEGKLHPGADHRRADFPVERLLFVPFGVQLPLWRRSAAWATAARWGLATSAVIEIGQWLTDVLVSSGRAADVNDLIANTAGAVLGFWAVRWATRTERRRTLVGSFAVTPAIRDEQRAPTG